MYLLVRDSGREDSRPSAAAASVSIGSDQSARRWPQVEAGGFSAQSIHSTRLVPDAAEETALRAGPPAAGGVSPQRAPSRTVVWCGLGGPWCNDQRPRRGAVAPRTAGWGVAYGRGLWAGRRGTKASRPRAVERGASGCGQGAQRPASSVRSGRPARERKVLGSPRLLRVPVILRERS